ncbi:MAG: hypothetical protein ABIF19_09395 [Planctomycetota bacterium]
MSNKLEPAKNPHGDAQSCSACHTSAVGGRNTLRFDGNVSRLCQSCHDGRLASREVHPVDIAPSASISQKIPFDFPFENGMLTCLSCHDVASRCTAPGAGVPDRYFLRGDRVPEPLAFCSNCHVQEDYQPFNAHDQFQVGEAKPDACLWCHVSAPDISSRLKEGASYELRGGVSEVCGNCHRMAKGHPTENAHMYATPSEEMMWYMSAYEMRDRMNMPLKQLLEYVRAARRTVRSIPFDESGRITCSSCHNPHEKGLLPNWNPRSFGAEPRKSVNHRLRVSGGISCRACHQK